MSEAEGIGLTERQRYWLEQVQACEASGKTIAEYAADQGIRVRRYWSRKACCRARSVGAECREQLSDRGYGG